MVALVCCLFGLSANAQYDYVREMELGGGDQIVEDLAGVAQILDTDAATLAAALEAGANDRDNTKMFFLQDAEDASTLYDNYTANGYGFWMTTEPKPINWGTEGFAWYCELAVNAEEGKLYLNIGNNDAAVAVGDELKASFVVQYGEKTVKFNVTEAIIEPAPEPVFDLPEPEVKISLLNVVAEKSFEITQTANASYKADQVSIDLTGVADLLGVTDETIAGAIAKMVYGVKPDWEFADTKSDSLTNAFTAGAPGFWFNSLGDGQSVVTNECVVGNHGGTGCAFYCEAFAYDAETKTLTANLGMYPDFSTVRNNTTRFAEVYLLAGNKAVKILLTLNIEPLPVLSFDQMTKVGEETVTVKRSNDAGYGESVFAVDADAIAALLGCEPSDLEMNLLNSDGEGLQGWGDTDGWMTGEGYTASWGSGNAVICIKYPSNLNTGDSYGNYWMCQYPGKTEDGATYTIPTYLKYQNSYYLVNVVITIGDEEVNPDDYVSVAERNFEIKVNPTTGGDYGVVMTAKIPLNDLETLLGTTTPTLYGQKQSADEKLIYTNVGTCDPKPGFWMTSDGYVTSWSDSNATWGVSYGDGIINKSEDPGQGVFKFFSYPDRNEVGNVSKGTLYLRNDATGKMISVNFTLTFTDEYIAPQAELEQVGSVSKDVALVTDGVRTAAELELDLTEVKTLLGLETEDDLYDLFSSDSKCFVGENASGEWAAPSSIDFGQYFDIAGKALNEATAEYSYNAYLEYNGGDVVTLYVDGIEPLAAGESVTLKLGLIYDNKVYAFYVKLMNEEDFTGISTAKAVKADGQLYDLSGRRVVKAQKGLYIQNGKKVVVK